MKGYPAYRISGLVYKGFKADSDIYLPVGKDESFVEAITFYMATNFPNIQTNNLNSEVRYTEAAYVGTWDE